tara:strand:+ start:176 stop:655 length:480 start_codon:yes stop_codon:yes gene_type:complete
MNNAGQFVDGDLSFWFVVAISTPFIMLIALSVITAFFSCLSAFAPAIGHFIGLSRSVFDSVSPPAPKVIYRDRPVRTFVYKERPVVKQPEPAKPPQKSSKDMGREIADRKLRDDVISGLKTLGVHKKDAQSLVDNIMAKDKYLNVDSLMNACLDAIKPS